MIQLFLQILITCTVYGAIDSLYQKSAQLSKLKLSFPIRCIRLSAVDSCLQDIV